MGSMQTFSWICGSGAVNLQQQRRARVDSHVDSGSNSSCSCLNFGLRVDLESEQDPSFVGHPMLFPLAPLPGPASTNTGSVPARRPSRTPQRTGAGAPAPADLPAHNHVQALDCVPFIKLPNGQRQRKYLAEFKNLGFGV
jgi:hypothetical protein